MLPTKHCYLFSHSVKRAHAFSSERG